MAWQEGDRTICEVLRQIADQCVGNDAVTELVIEAADMAKRMDAKLKEYNANYYDEFWRGQDYFRREDKTAHKELVNG